MSSLHGATALVTGGTGFIGGRLIEVLTSQFGMKVKAVIRNTNSAAGSYRIARDGAEVIEGDITNEAQMTKAMEGCDYVFHCAFGTTGDPKLDRHVTLGGTTALARAAAAAKVRHFVFTSTMVVFGDTPATVDETFTPNKMWDWPYPHHKLEAEKAVIAEHERSGLTATILRLGSVYGPWGPAFTLYPMAWLAAGRLSVVDDGQGVSNACYIDDVVQAMVLAAVRDDVKPEMFIIRGPDRVTWREFYGAYERMLGVENRLVSMSREDARAHPKRARRAAIKSALPSALGVLKRDAGFKSLAGQLPLIKPAWKFYRRYINPPSDKVAPPPAQAAPELPLTILPDMMWGYYASTSDYSIDKARTVLGYAPQYDLARGMALTGQWAEWAGLAPRR